MHRWLVSLDDAVKQFKARNNTEQKKKKDGSRPRSSSTSGGGYSTKTPPRIKPSRPAPPVPQVKCMGVAAIRLVAFCRERKKEST